MRIITANLNGIRSASSKGFFDWLKRQQADVVCVQEAKAQAADMSPAMHNPGGFRGYFSLAEKKGYAGVGLYCRREPDVVHRGFGSHEHDGEGRYLQADFGRLSVVSLYLPSGSAGPHRQASSSASWSFHAAAEEAAQERARSHPVRRLEHRPQGN